MIDLIQTTMKKGAGLWNSLVHPPQVAPTPYDVVYRHRKLRLLRYRPPAGRPRRHPIPLLLVPSLINRHYILDLSPGRSLVAYLLDQGFDVFMITWGQPGAEERYLSFDQHITGLLHRCVQRAARAAGASQVSLIGYCMGGTFTAIYAALYPHLVHRLVNLAAPVDFSAGGLLAQWTEPRYMNVDLLVDTLGNIPWPMLQASFHMLAPTLLANKTLYVYDRLEESEFLRNFLSLETWGNDNVSFPGECFRRYIKDLYQENRLVAGTLTVAGRRVDLGQVRCPVINVVAQSDNIVPRGSAAPLTHLVGSSDSQLWEEPGSHIGAVVSSRAAASLWPRLAEQLGARPGSLKI